MLQNWSFKSATEKAEHLKAIGQNEIYLSEGELPYNLVTRCEPGGSHRIDMSTSIWFYAEDKKSGLVFRWSFDIENREANGRGYYLINVKACEEIIKKLKGKGL
jgi:hypothetical protein